MLMHHIPSTVAGPMKLLTCCECAVAFAVPETFMDQRCEDAKWVYCPNGHQMGFGDFEPNEKDREIRDLKLKLLHEQEQREAREAESSPPKLDPPAVMTRRRAQCPHCKKSYMNKVRLRTHLESVHGLTDGEALRRELEKA